MEQSAAWRSSLDPITGTYQEEVKTSCRQPAELRKQVRAFREYDQKSVAAAGPPAKAREPYDNEVVKCWTAEITKTTDIFKRLTQRDLSLTRWLRSECLARKWIANRKPIDRLAIPHVLRVKCAGASMERSRDDE